MSTSAWQPAAWEGLTTVPSPPKFQRRFRRKSLPRLWGVAELSVVVGSPGWARTSDFMINSSSERVLQPRDFSAARRNCAISRHIAIGMNGLLAHERTRIARASAHRQHTREISVNPIGCSVRGSRSRDTTRPGKNGT